MEISTIVPVSIIADSSSTTISSSINIAPQISSSSSNGSNGDSSMASSSSSSCLAPVNSDDQCNSAKSTICYLATNGSNNNNSGGDSKMDRLKLILPLCANDSEENNRSEDNECSRIISPPFFTTTDKHDLHPHHRNIEHEDCFDDRTPVNAEKQFIFTPDCAQSFSSSASSSRNSFSSFSSSSSSSSASSISSLLSSCPTIDSGRESIIGEPLHHQQQQQRDQSAQPDQSYVDEYLSDLATDRILKFFASDRSKSSRSFGGELDLQDRAAAGDSKRKIIASSRSIDDDEDDDDDALYSDESTLSESSPTISPASLMPPVLSGQDFDPTKNSSNISMMMMITPESVIAAIDAKIKRAENEQQQQQKKCDKQTFKQSQQQQQQKQPKIDNIAHDNKSSIGDDIEEETQVENKKNVLPTPAATCQNKQKSKKKKKKKKITKTKTQINNSIKKETEMLCGRGGGDVEENLIQNFGTVDCDSLNSQNDKDEDEDSDSENDADDDLDETNLDGDEHHQDDNDKNDDFEDDDDDDSDDCRIPPLIRSTSLKTGKTPPGTPSGKKIVRFADALGLDLESVRHIADDVPYMPPLAAFKSLKLDDDDRQWLFGQRTFGGNPQQNQQQSKSSLESSSSSASSSAASSSALSSSSTTSSSGSSNSIVITKKPALRMLFTQPSSDPGPFIERVRSFRVCLENCLVTGPSGPTDMFTITCIARVLNVGFEKAVTLRFTTNEWLTWTDVLASYVPNSCDQFSDKFAVTFHLAVNSNGHQTMLPGQRLLFALRYLANGSQEFWDNNMGLNYSIIYQRN